MPEVKQDAPSRAEGKERVRRNDGHHCGIVLERNGDTAQVWWGSHDAGDIVTTEHAAMLVPWGDGVGITPPSTTAALKRKNAKRVATIDLREPETPVPGSRSKNGTKASGKRNGSRK